MSHQNFNPKTYQKDDVQFKIISSSQSNKSQSNEYRNNNNFIMSSQNNSIQPQYQTQTNQVVDYYSNTNPMQQKRQQRINESSDIFNDILEGGGVEPSINETIRESIQCSFVSSEHNQSKQMYQDLDKQNSDTMRDQYVMNRMNWITYLKVLFDQLESFNQNKQKHVDNSNFTKGLKKIKNLLPLQPRNDYYKNCSDVAFTYKEVESCIISMHKYITWDMVIDIFLTKQFAASMVNNPKKAAAAQQIKNNDIYPEPQQIDDSQISDIQYEDGDYEESFKKKNQNNAQQQRKLKQNFGSGDANQQNPPQYKKKRNDDFFLSFADSLINHGNLTAEHHNQQHIVAQAPLLGNPNLGLMDKDDDEACEIDSEDSDEESKDHSNSRRQKSKLEESIRSSRTATFKSIKRNSIHHGTSNTNTLQNSLPTNVFQGVANTQDSYYATLKTAKLPPQAYQSQQHQPQPLQQQIYYQQQYQQPSQQQQYQKQGMNDSRHLSNQMSDTEDGQVEVASNRSHRSSNSRYKQREYHQASNSLAGDIMFNYEEPNIIGGNEKSTRISSQNSIQKINVVNQNTTILSHNSSQSSQQSNQLKNNNASKISNLSSQLSHHSQSQISQQQQQQQQQQSHFIDLDLQGKGLRNFEIDFKQAYGSSKSMRSINLSCNSLVKVPPTLEKSLQYMNISHNKLKSLQGIDHYVNLKFLNVSNNMISSGNQLVLLQSLRELVIGGNMLTNVKEIGQLKNLQLLDLSFNKLIEFEKLIPLQNLKKMTVLSLQGNLMQKQALYDQQVTKILPQVKVLDPQQIKDFSQYSQMEHVCFTDGPEQPSNLIIDQISQPSMSHLGSAEKRQENNNQYQKTSYVSVSDQRKRSQTPNRDRSKSQLGQQSSSQKQIDNKLKSTVISPKRFTIDPSAVQYGLSALNKSPSHLQQKQAQLPQNLTHQQPPQSLKSSLSSQQSQIRQQQQQNPPNQQYNDNQFRMQSKVTKDSKSHNINSARNNNNKNVQQQQQDRTVSRTKNVSAKRDMSQNKGEEDKNIRDRSISNNKAKTQTNSLAASGRSTAAAQQQQQLTQTQQSSQSQKDQPVKKVSVNVNLAKTFGSQGKLTPRRINTNTSNTINQTPRQEKPTHYYKKSFCQTEDESSLIHHNNTQEHGDNDQHSSPSDKNTVRTVKTQESSGGKKNVQNVRNINNKKDDIGVTIASMNIMSPGQKLILKAPTNLSSQSNSSRNSIRPVTTLKQRMIPGSSQHMITKEYQIVSSNQTLTYHNNASGINPLSNINPPQSTKNSSHSFIFEQPNVQGRQTPTNGASSRPSSQLQKFINAKPSSQSNQNNQPNQTQNTTAQRPSHSRLLVNPIPSQQLINLPPKAYQSKGGNPGDKKSKAEMSLSVISSQRDNTTLNQIHNTSSSQHTIQNTSHSHKQSSSILQTGGTLEESKFDNCDEQCDESSNSRSMSPVLEESNNIKKLRVDLTQFMNKQ